MQPANQLHLSALALEIYLQCQLRYRFRYVEGLFWSRAWGSSPAERKAVERGHTFHLMARRLYTGLDPGGLADPVEQTELDGWIHLLAGFLPRRFDQAYYPELELKLTAPDLRLQAKFDLLVVAPDGQATIYDWKTERTPPSRRRVLQSLQTLVYRYALCAAGGTYSPRGRFSPEEVAMLYWNPLFPHRWERLVYTAEQFRQDSDRLGELCARIAHTPASQFLPTSDDGVCRRCEYRTVCKGQPAEAAAEPEEPPVDDAVGLPSEGDTLFDLP